MSKQILHTCVGVPTYFDLLPGDVLQYCIIPFLGWEDRIHLNMLTPPGDRTPPKKIPKERIIGHQLVMSASMLKKPVTIASDMINLRHRHRLIGRKGMPSQMAITETILNALRQFKRPHVGLLLQYNDTFRNVVIDRLADYSSADQLSRITRIAQRNEMKALVSSLLDMLAAYPFDKKIAAKRWLSERITQVETAMFHEEWTQCGHVIRRQGDIYSVVE